VYRNKYRRLLGEGLFAEERKMPNGLVLVTEKNNGRGGFFRG